MSSAPPDPKQSVPLSAEHLEVKRQKSVTGQVRVATITRQRRETINEQLVSEHAEVERVSVGKLISEIPPIREEGDTTIIPVVEEVLVVEKKLLLKEEVRVRRLRHIEPRCEQINLREQDAVITRSPVASAPHANQTKRERE